MSTGGVFAWVLDSDRRPITAGGFTKDAPLILEDEAARAGLPSGSTPWCYCPILI